MANIPNNKQFNGANECQLCNVSGLDSKHNFVAHILNKRHQSQSYRLRNDLFFKHGDCCILVNGK